MNPENHELPLAAPDGRPGIAPAKHYWRSLADLAGSPALQELLGEEFPEGAAKLPASFSRRKFLTLMGASLALAGLNGCSVRPAPEGEIVPYVHPPKDLVLGVPLFFATTMTHAGSGVGLLVESHMGRPTKIEGNPDHPASLGATSIYHQASVLTLYDPDRAKTPTYVGQSRAWGEAGAAIRAAMRTLREKRGAGFRLLTESVVSPTLAGQLEDLFHDLPEAKWHLWEPLHHDAAWHAAQTAFGEPVTPIYDLSQADVVLSLDADFLGPAEGNLRDAADFMDRRRVRTTEQEAKQARMNRLYVVETEVTCTGAKADHRLALRSQDIEGIARAIATRLGIAAGGKIVSSLEPWVKAVADDLEEHRQRSLILAGPGQPAAVHLLAHALNDRLGNVGKTVRYIAPVDARPGDRTQSLRELAEDMGRGKVEFLLILGGNPAYNVPADIAFAENLQTLAARSGSLVVRHGLYVDETSYLCQWHLPESHYLEAWSDARAYDGTESIVQPLIEPLYQGRSAHEVIALVHWGLETPGREIVRNHWRRRWEARKPTGNFEDFWETSLHDGLVRWQPPAGVEPGEKPGAKRAAEQPIHGTGATPKSVQLKDGWEKAIADHPHPGPLPKGEGELEAPLGDRPLEIVFRPDPSVFDGSFANNGWLQELPKPITKLTWGNAAIMSLATAAQLDASLGSYAHGGEHGGHYVPVVELQLGELKVRAPIWIMPGHAEGSVTIYLGHGRKHAGLVGGTPKGSIGFSAYRLRTSDRPWFAPGVVVTKTGDEELVACTQGHHTMAGREVVRSGTLGEYQEQPRFADEARHHTAQTRRAQPPLTMYPEFDYSPPKRKWGMLIDLTTCIGCNACVVACQAENNIPVVGKDQVAAGRAMHWLRVDRYLSGPYEQPREFHFQPVPCMHCEKAPCEYVCPTEATVHSHDGLNEMIYNRCVGTRFCSNNCPYKVRRFNFFQYSDGKTPSRRLQYNPDVTVRSRGVMEKCTYCVQRIRQAEISAAKGDRRIADGEVLTACQAACPTQAITFGDLNDPASKVRCWRDLPLHYGLLADLNTQPRTTYLAELKNPAADLKGT